MTPFFRFFVLTAVLSSSLLAQDQGPPEPAPSEPAPPAARAPAVRAPRGSIEDIAAHRIEPLRYVRRAADIVNVDSSLLDLSGDVFTLGDVSVSLDEFARRAIMFGGLAKVGKQLTTLITDQEIKRRAAEGVDSSVFDLNEEDQARKYEEYLSLITMQAKQAADGDSELAAEYTADAVKQFEDSINQSVGMESFLNSLSAELRFEKVFLSLPDEPITLPADYPIWRATEEHPVVQENLPVPPGVSPTTWSALSMNPNTRAMRQLVLSSLTEGQKIPALFRGQITSAIRLGVLQDMNLTWFYDDMSLPENVICRLGDTDITVDNVWPLIKGSLTPVDHHLILRELLTLRGMRKVLESADSWLDDEATDAAFREHEAVYEGTLFPLSAIIMFQGYSDLDRYREHYRYRAAYNAWREPQITDEDLDNHYRRGGRLFFEKGSVILDLAYKGTAPFGGTFGPDLFDQAEAALLQAVGELSTPADWRKLASDLPKPAFRQQISDSERSFERNQLRLRMSESMLSIFVRGYSMADEIFYLGTPGEVIGPHRMDNRRHGWGAEVNTGVWMARVGGYVASKPLDPMVERNLDNARQDFLDLNYLYWSQECLAALLKDASPR